jgi:transposase
MLPAYVKPYAKRSKTDAGDADAICEAVCRPIMSFVPVKTAAQQSEAIALKIRNPIVRQRNQTINTLRAPLSEFGVSPGGSAGLRI